jgi:hypothetical protein
MVGVTAGRLRVSRVHVFHVTELLEGRDSSIGAY